LESELESESYPVPGETATDRSNPGPESVPEAIPIDPVLELQYNLRLRHPERGEIYDDMAARSASFRARAPGMVSIAYASEPACVLDFFPSPNADQRAPLFVFVHGGYWRALERGMFSFLAEVWLERGVHVAMPGYTLAPEVPVAHIGAQVGSAMALLRERADLFGIDLQRVIVSGHSAGAQLAANVLECGAWRAAGFAGVSGVYDLKPLLSTTVNHDVHFDAQSARALSPIHRPTVSATRYLCAVGAAETDGFRGQSRDYVDYLHGQQTDAHYMEVPQRNHFDILDDLGDADRDLFRAAFRLLEVG